MVDLDDDGVLENVFVISDWEEPFTITYAKLIVQNAMTGEIIDALDLGDHYISFVIDFANLTDSNAKDILLDTHGGGMGTPSSTFLYGFDNKKLKEKELQLSSDIEYNYLDDFKIEIASREFDKVYSFEIGKEYRDEYIRLDYYTRNGKVLGEFDGYGLEQKNIYHIEELNRDGIIYKLPFHGSYLNKDYLGLINIVYIYDGGWKPYSMEMNDHNGNKMKHKKYAEKSELPEPPKENDTIAESKRILRMTKSEVIDNFGQPNSIENYGGEYYDYGDKFIFFVGNGVSKMWWLNNVDKFGIEGRLSNKKIKELYGKPDYEGNLGGDIDEYGLNYAMEGLNLQFIGIDEDYGGFVQVWRE